MKNYTGYVNTVISALLFGTIGIFNRLIPLNAFVQTSGRFLIAVVFFALLSKEARKIPSKKDFLGFFLAGFCIAAAGGLFALSIQYIPVGTAGFCYQILPVFTLIMSMIAFKQRATPILLGSIALAIFGTALLAPASAWHVGGNKFLGVALSIIAAIAGAGMIVSLKMLAGTYSSPQRMLWMCLVAGILLLPSVFLVPNQTYNYGTINLLIALSAFAGLGGYFANKGLDSIDATRSSILLYIEPVAAAVYAAIIFHEHFTLLNCGGAVLIVAAGLIILLNPVQTLENCE